MAADDRAGRKGVAQRRGRRERRAPTSRPRRRCSRPTGRELLIPYLGLDSIAQRIEYAVAGVRSGPARTLKGECSTPALSPDGKLIACKTAGQVAIADLGGACASPSRHVRAVVARRPARRRGGEEHRGPERIRPLDRAHPGVARAWSRDGTTLALVRPGALALVRPGAAGAPHVVYRGGSGSRTGSPSRPTAAPSCSRAGSASRRWQRSPVGRCGGSRASRSGAGRAMGAMPSRS